MQDTEVIRSSRRAAPAAAALLVLVALLILSAIGIRSDLTAPVPPNAFVGSQACASCHSSIHSDWQNSLHHKMMRPANAVGAVEAKWLPSGIQPKFQLSDAAWVVGSKWEQQFMGHSEGRDTMLPGVWSVGLKSWSIQGWDGWQTPDPQRRCHGCHVVGFDRQSGKFAEAGIGCESCHGKGSRHSVGQGQDVIYTGLESEVCGQCHTRGHATDSEYFFPVDYQPGAALDPVFSEIRPDYIQNSSQWWGNGLERDRHQEYPAWRRGGHANALRSLTVGYDGRFGPVDGACLRCHSAEGAIHADRKVSLSEARNGITCAVCHNVHGALDQVRATCTSCHDNGPLHHEIQTLAEHVPCPKEAGVDCADCHMPVTVKVGGQLRLHSHAPGITSPGAGAEFGSPSSCANGGCHESKSPEQLQKSFDAFYATDSRTARNESPPGDRARSSN